MVRIDDVTFVIAESVKSVRSNERGNPRRPREQSMVALGLASQRRYRFDYYWNVPLKAGVRRAPLEQLAQVDPSPDFDAKKRARMAILLPPWHETATWRRLRSHGALAFALIKLIQSPIG